MPNKTINYQATITETVVELAEYEGEENARFVIWDKLLTGFGLRVYPSGRKSFIIFYRLHGRKHLLTIGNCAVLTVEQARVRARNKFLEITDNNKGFSQMEGNA